MRSNSYVDRHFLCALVKNLFDGIFIFYWLCWFFIRFTRLQHFPIPFLNSWLTDLVFVPIIVHVASITGSFLFNKGKPHGYPLYQIWLISAIVSLLFEYVMPNYTDYNTGIPMTSLPILWEDYFTFYSISPVISEKIPMEPIIWFAAKIKAQLIRTRSGTI
ncbi:hypothetical protein KUH03_34340 [Sphingobacterium sp. E70]|uniref:hypothetical protein n=1 Tax=Sphingobacterium sp. E70 TaxID=2853439 RepID=UPI00211C99CC|nr:hypothetical protein [Sphingobacterium sp. E70]ULT24102.1 hypothetical protein KUH03_34340 [Sphingobacterium sp. E70]